MLETWGMFLLGLLFLMLGGDSVVKGASGLARHYGLSPFVAGLVLVAFATSIPELVVNGRAAFVGAQSLALGNAVGSNLVNFGLTLGLAAIGATGALVVRWRVLSPLLVCFIVLGIATIGLGLDDVLSRIDGMLLLLAFVAVVAFALARSRSDTEEVHKVLSDYTETRGGLGLNAARLVISAVVLFFGAKWIVQSAPTVGASMGMGPLLTGLVPVAIGTALPEIAAAVLAARRGQGELVAGHVIGSSLCNLTLVLGGMATFRALPLPASFVKFELPAAIAFAIALYPMLRGDLRISRIEGGILVAAYAAWLVFVLASGAH
ncbi:sodium:calcium antiporter [Lysobacter sp. A6]|uniref:Sodium:calcium antiporter n=1 Tax=Noviluteimonas lactosilytica TaxID=2888523 RepID=A0ABS8JGQ7_9GAMM|nr:sodium:calcium antiporter [Lysobacter lactosilyticus]MCC8362739.1 sodium:calcium antiporter [Lysobacter lactosilyticus]